MADTLHYRKYEKAKRKLERKLEDIDRKLDHIIFRLRKEDPRVFSDVDGCECAESADPNSLYE